MTALGKEKAERTRRGGDAANPAAAPIPLGHSSLNQFLLSAAVRPFKMEPVDLSYVQSFVIFFLPSLQVPTFYSFIFHLFVCSLTLVD